MPVFSPLTPSGTAFPTAPATGDRFRRTDRNLEYSYDGTRWLSAGTYVLPIAMQDSVNPSSAAGLTQRVANPGSLSYDIYVEQFVFNSLNTVATSSANFYWGGLVARPSTGSSVTVGSSLSSSGDAQNQWVSHRTQPNTVISSSSPGIEASYTTTGSPQSYLSSVIEYRRVG